MLLLATNNAGKARELAALLDGVSVVITTPQEQGIVLEVEETGTTFEENAALKATAFATASGLLCLADDSGLEVDALGGEPGIRSARYAGPHATDDERVRYLLAKLEGIEWGRRQARFRAVLALAEPGGDVQLFHGVCDGVITTEQHGAGGFGYDPVFYIPSLGKSMAELDADEKNRVSHRGQATRRVVEHLKRVADAPK